MATNLKAAEKERDNTVIRPFKKYPLSTTEDPRKIFNYPYLSDHETISYIKNQQRVMFIIRGPPYTKKTKLSNILRDTYSGSPYCSMVKWIDYFREGGNTNDLKQETHEKAFYMCQKMLIQACLTKKPTIIVQNTHMRKKEMESWLSLAAKFDYTVIMVATTYKFDITPEELVREQSLDLSYLKMRLDKWEDVPPIFTACFLSPNDSEYIRHITLEKLKTLMKIQRFRSFIGTDDVTRYFHPRANLNCLAGYSADVDKMKNYYFSTEVQTAYGKRFPISIIGFLITKSDIIGVVQVDSNLESLVLDDPAESDGATVNGASVNHLNYGKTTKFPLKGNLPLKSSGYREKFKEGEKIPIKTCRPIHLAQKGFGLLSMEKLNEQFSEGLQLMSDGEGILKEKYFDFENGSARLNELKDGFWFANVSQKFCFSSIFTGFYG